MSSVRWTNSTRAVEVAGARRTRQRRSCALSVNKAASGSGSASSRARSTSRGEARELAQRYWPLRRAGGCGWRGACSRVLPNRTLGRSRPHCRSPSRQERRAALSRRLLRDRPRGEISASRAANSPARSSTQSGCSAGRTRANDAQVLYPSLAVLRRGLVRPREQERANSSWTSCSRRSRVRSPDDLHRVAEARPHRRASSAVSKSRGGPTRSHQDTVDRCGRAPASGRAHAAAELYAVIGSRPDEAYGGSPQETASGRSPSEEVGGAGEVDAAGLASVTGRARA